MPTFTCLTAITETIAQGIEHLHRRNPFSQSGNHTAPIPVQNHPRTASNADDGAQHGQWKYLLQWMHICRPTSGTAVFRHVDGSAVPSREGTDSPLALSADMHASLLSWLVTPAPGELQQLMDEVWSKVYQGDADRRAGRRAWELMRELPELHAIARDETHPSRSDATLLEDVPTRPMGQDAPSLEDYLAGKVEAGLQLYMDIPTNPDFRTFNSILPGLATSTLDYNSAGRTLLFKGATHLIGIPSTPADTDERLTEEQLDRKRRLQKTVFSFPKYPAAGTEQLELTDFDAMIDPLDNLGVYESAGPHLA